MNILQLRTEFRDNGPGTQSLTISEELRQRGYHVIYCSSKGSLAKKILNKNFKYYFIEELSYDKRNIINIIKSIFKLSKILKKEKVNIVHAHNAASVFITNIASIFSFRKVKVYQSVRGVEVRKNYGWRNLIFKILIVNKYFAVSEFTKKILISFGVASNKIVVTYNGTDLNRFDISKKNTFREEIRKEFNIPNKALVIGIIGRQDGFKGHHKLLKSFEKLYNDYPNVYVLLVGDGNALASNQKYAVDKNIDKRTKFAGLRFDVEKFHASFDIFTLLSNKGLEMFPNVLIEAMTYEIPFVATNTTGVPETASNGEGFICDCEDIDCFTEKFKKLLNDKELRLSMGKIGRKSVENIFNIQAVVNKIEHSYLKH